MRRIQSEGRATGDRPTVKPAAYRYQRFLTWKLWMTSLPSLTYSLACNGAALPSHVE